MRKTQEGEKGEVRRGTARDSSPTQGARTNAGKWDGVKRCRGSVRNCDARAATEGSGDKSGDNSKKKRKRN